jgi:S-adenosylmethionine/arginine decarboxylase-like enzyme
MKTQICLGCDVEVECQDEGIEENINYLCNRCGHYKAEKTVIALYGAERQNDSMKKKLQKRLVKTKDSHNRMVTTKQKLKKMRKEGISFIITVDENSPKTVELWNVEQVGGVSKIALDDER